MDIIKRDGKRQDYCPQKITAAVRKAFLSVDGTASEDELEKITHAVDKKLRMLNGDITVEIIQNTVEQTLMEQGYYQQSKNYILYRNEHARLREMRYRITEQFADSKKIDVVLTGIQHDFPAEQYGLNQLADRFFSFIKNGMAQGEKMDMLIKAAIELTSQQSPQWEFIAARLLMLQFTHNLFSALEPYHIECFSDKVYFLTEQGLYGKYITENYSKNELDTAAAFIDDTRNRLLTYSSLDLLLKRYVIRDHQNAPLETPQEMFLGIALHLAIPEKKNRLMWVHRFYDMLSTLKVTMATPTLANARKPFHQLSSCFIDTVPDSLIGIYRSIDNFAQVSKYGGGMGLYFGKVRARNSSIRGFKGAAGGVVRWIRLANDTAVAVDQLGVRQGAVAVYLDAWHRDLPEFLALRTNNGDERMKAHDVFPAVCYPDLFWKMARENLDSDWYLMCPHDIMTHKGYCLEDCWGDEWEKRYWDCVNDPDIKKRVVKIKEIVRLVIKSAVETGTPFVFNRDTVNRANPNGNKGIIYCSNLCTEIAQNMGAIESVDQKIKTVDGETVVVTVTKPGEFVVCNLASLSLGRINVDSDNEIREVTRNAVRALDNVIDLNFFPVPYAKINNLKYRPIGLGVSGYHHMLAKHGITWESDEHLSFADKLFEKINYAAISASCENASEKGSYELFKGSDWQTGAYFEKRGYKSPAWQELRRNVTEHGMRNGWLLAVAPTSSTSIIARTTAGIDPIMSRFFLEEKRKGLIPCVAPDLSPSTYWYYKSAYNIDQSWSVRAAGIRQRHIDQSQSMNLYITSEYTFRQILNLYILAFEQGVKTIYYIRSKSLEVEDCEACSS